MNETWKIALFTTLFSLMLSALSFIAKGVFKISNTLSRKVDRDECKSDMGVHCKRIDLLEEKVNTNITDIMILKEKTK